MSASRATALRPARRWRRRWWSGRGVGAVLWQEADGADQRLVVGQRGRVAGPGAPPSTREQDPRGAGEALRARRGGMRG